MCIVTILLPMTTLAFTHTRARAHAHGHHITCSFNISFLFCNFMLTYGLHPKMKYYSTYLRSKLAEWVNDDCDTSTDDNVGIGMLKLVFTFKHNGVSIYSMKCFNINKELTFIITCIHLDHCATWVQHEFSSNRIARSRKLHLGNTVMASEKIWWILIDGP